MEQHALPVFSAWANFYVIVGSSAAALTGLQFVVVVLATNLNTLRSVETVSAFATPTIVHFCVALLVSATLSAPWPTVMGVTYGLGACGILGVVYAISVTVHARRQGDYRAVFEDWLFHCAFPIIAYAMLTLASVFLSRHTAKALFVVAGAVLFLLFIGIHNAWDSVTYIALKKSRAEESAEEKESTEASDQKQG